MGSRTASGCASTVPESPHWYPYSHSNWASTANHLCKDGVEQSPVDFPNCNGALLRPMPNITWAAQPVQLLNNGHTVQITAMGSVPGKMTFPIAGITKSYTLMQCHFHGGSEHTIGGSQYPLEVHCVHSMDGIPNNQRFGVFGLFYEVGVGRNSFLATIEDHLPTHETSAAHRRLSPSEVSYDLFGSPLEAETKRRLATVPNVSQTLTGNLDLKELYNGVDLQYFWNYDGSFTTPPCTQAVDFYIFMDKARVQQAQLDKFTAAMGWRAAGGNFRPPQALNTRTIYGCTVTPSPLGNHPLYPYNEAHWEDGVGISSSPSCRFGAEQSPIDFAMCRVPEQRAALGITWASQPVEVVNNGHTVQINARAADPGKMTVNGTA
eukprot:CAMPEP_0168453510 /NCGR_PEP_ID=MMETSP0228-20121227/49724_1 /TAXON_ID=133427 /ORGANISM="Protoceratium reticulatum, Strain CCCM 535 (=CCMP 1889)" /LENGTH=377 /DNA_ID=CAMNT_0008468231 /DNA_START=1 /DNA_END=1131 /DNA_ORIENTATION=-